MRQFAVALVVLALVITGSRSLAAHSVAAAYVSHSPQATDQSAGAMSRLAGYSVGDGLPAVKEGLFGPSGVAHGPDGQLYIVETGSNLVVRVDLSGILHTVMGGAPVPYRGEGPWAGSILSNPSDVVVDQSGNVYVSDTGDGVVLRADQAGAASVYAGGGSDYGTNIPATQARLVNPTGLTFDTMGNLYIADETNNRIVRVDHSTQTLTVIAGSSRTYGYSGDGGPATQAELAYPDGVAVDSAGNVYIGDTMNYRIRRVDASTGIIATYAGTDVGGYTGDGGPAAQAEVGRPSNIALDPSGTLYFTDNANARLRRIDPSPPHIVTTIAGTGSQGSIGDGGPASRAELIHPGSLTLDASGGIYVSTYGWVRYIDPTGIIKTVAGNGSWTADDGGPSTQASLYGPEGIAVDAAGDIFIADNADNRVRKIDTSGTISTIVGTGAATDSGDGGPAVDAGLHQPRALALDSSGRLYISEWTSIRRVNTDGTITTIAGNGTCGPFGDGGPATAASVCGPSALTFDGAGNLYIADTYNDRVRRIGTDGIITTYAGNGQIGTPNDGGPATQASIAQPKGLAFDGAGNLYISTAWQRVVRVVNHATGIVSRYAGMYSGNSSRDDVPATTSALSSPQGLAMDGKGNLYIGEVSGAGSAEGFAIGNDVRRVDANGIITTLTPTCYPPNGPDEYTTGWAWSTCLGAPANLAVDSAGNLYISDEYLYLLWKVTAAGADGMNVRPVAPPIVSSQVSPSPNADGWNTSNVSVTWSVSAPGSQIASSRGCNAGHVTGETSAQGVTLTCTATNGAGQTSSRSVVVKIDKTPPQLYGEIALPANKQGWYHSPVSVYWVCDDVLSGIPQQGCPADTILFTDGTGLRAHTSVSDVAGNRSTASSTGINLDRTSPTMTATELSNGVSYKPGTWTTHSVTVNSHCTDSLSGVASVSPDTIVRSEGANQSVRGTCTDVAGNTFTLAVTGIAIDHAAPTLNSTVTPNPVLLHGTAAVSPGASDAVSGIASQHCSAPTTASVGMKAVPCSAKDVAGNRASRAAPYMVMYGQSVLAPLGTSSRGAKVTFRLRLVDAAGKEVSGLGITVNALGVATAKGAMVKSLQASFAYSESLGYVLQVDTVGMSAGDYQLKLTMGADPTTHLIDFVLK